MSYVQPRTWTGPQPPRYRIPTLSAATKPQQASEPPRFHYSSAPPPDFDQAKAYPPVVVPPEERKIGLINGHEINIVASARRYCNTCCKWGTVYLTAHRISSGRLWPRWTCYGTRNWYTKENIEPHSPGGKLAAAIPLDVLKAHGIGVDELTITHDSTKTGDWTGEIRKCCVKGCTNVGAEEHHWAPRSIFKEYRDDYDAARVKPDYEALPSGAAHNDWPTSYLCLEHHKMWHQRTRVANQFYRRRPGRETQPAKSIAS